MTDSCDTQNTKYTWCLTSTETVRLVRDGGKGGGGGNGSGDGGRCFGTDLYLYSKMGEVSMHGGSKVDS